MPSLAIYEVQVLLVCTRNDCYRTHGSWHCLFFDDYSLNPSTDLAVLDINEGINVLAGLA